MILILEPNSAPESADYKVLSSQLDRLSGINYRVHREVGGVQEVRLFRNGSLAHVWHHNVLPPGRQEVVLETTLDGKRSLLCSNDRGFSVRTLK